MTQRNLILQEGSYLLTMAASYFRDGEQERFYKRALAIDEQLGDPGQFKGSLGQLADFYRLKERYAEAELLYNRLIAACDEEKDNFNLYYLEKVADFYRKQKRYAEAKLLYERALEIYEQHCEPEDVSRFMTRTRYTILLQSIKSDEDLKKLKEDP